MEQPEKKTKQKNKKKNPTKKQNKTKNKIVLKTKTTKTKTKRNGRSNLPNSKRWCPCFCFFIFLFLDFLFFALCGLHLSFFSFFFFSFCSFSVLSFSSSSGDFLSFFLFSRFFYFCFFFFLSFYMFPSLSWNNRPFVLNFFHWVAVFIFIIFHISSSVVCCAAEFRLSVDLGSNPRHAGVERLRQPNKRMCSTSFTIHHLIRQLASWTWNSNRSWAIKKWNVNVRLNIKWHAFQEALT